MKQHLSFKKEVGSVERVEFKGDSLGGRDVAGALGQPGCVTTVAGPEKIGSGDALQGQGRIAVLARALQPGRGLKTE